MKINLKDELVWVEVSKNILKNNIRQFRELVGKDTILCPCIKGNAYGHGLTECGRIYVEAGADWLGVNALYEARALRRSGIDSPIYILGYVPFDGLEEACDLDCRLVVYNKETIDKLAEITRRKQISVKVHLKIETGNNRQGLREKELIDFAKYIQGKEGMEIEGASTHFANIEDTTDHSYAEMQLENFKKIIENLKNEGLKIPIKHCANSAATILFKKTYFEMVRPGIATYGMWPSNETFVSYVKDAKNGFKLEPALTWKTRIAQIKTVPAGEYIGYGCTYKTTSDIRLAILPIGYYDGYDRALSGAGAYVLIHGKRAPLRGRVCMNIIMVDVTDIPEAALEDEVVLMGRDGDESVSAEQFASWAGTINYEVTTRINERIPRLFV